MTKRKDNAAEPVPAEPQITYLGEVQRLHLGPDDALVVSVPHPLTMEQSERVREFVRKHLGERRKVLVLADGIKLGVLSADEVPVE